MSEVLYRKHRPSLFEEVYGQEHVIKILSQSLSNNRVAHAYVFAGPRGSGKTTIARILAKELGVQGVDIIEIDAASHRGIDDIRELRDSVQFQPTQGDTKIYILDEVHMLTNEAFNALLKTLEEPPAHAYFVLCTTEPQKIPLTIMSRCVQLPFKQATEAELISFISHFALVEGVQLSEGAIQLLAENADGAFRDAMVLLEKVMGLESESVLEPIDIINGLGLVSGLHVDQMMSKIEQKDLNGLLSLIESLADQGVDIVEITNKLLVKLSRGIVGSMSDSGLDNKTKNKHNITMLKALILAREDMSILKDSQVALIAHISDAFVLQEVSLVGDDFENTDESKEIIDSTIISREVTKSQDSEEKSLLIVKEDVTQLSEWERILFAVKQKNSSVEALLKESKIQSVDKDRIVIEFPFAFHKNKIESAGNMDILQNAVYEVFMRRLSIVCTLKDENSSQKSVEHNDIAPPPDELSSDDLLAQAQEVFGGQMIE